VLRRIALIVPLLALPLIAQDPPAPANAPQDPPIPADTQVITTPSGLKYSVLAPGDGVTKAKRGDIIRMRYTGWLPNGKVFDSTARRADAPFFFPLGVGRVIKGWDEAGALMTKGERLKLTIPPELAYGDRGQGPIPAKATLIFEVEMVDIANPFHAPNKEAQKKTESGLVYEVLREGTGEPPSPTDLVKLRFAAWTATGDYIASTEIEMHNEAITGACGKLPLPQPIFSEGAALLKVGACYRFEASASRACGERLPPGLAAETPTVWEIELVAILKPMPIPAFALTADDKLQKTASGLGYEVIKEGTGKTPKVGKSVTVHYAGWLTNGTLFDSSYQRAEPTTFQIGGVIQGWNEGLQLMKEGSIYKFTIPGNLGYGKPGNKGAGIPPDATLVFYIELISCAE
jgi:peptidylprolyl isomerase